MADDDYNAAIIDKMVQKVHEGFDVAAANCFMSGGEMKNCSSPIKELITRLGAFVVFRFGGVGVHDPTNAFRLFTQRVIDLIEIESTQGFTFSSELLAKALRLKWKAAEWPAPGSEDTELGVLMEPEVRHGEAEVHTRVQA
jgi:dolichol-phosphate mannosyltransferase